MPKGKVKEVIEIQEIDMAELRVNILGTSPMIMHRFARKAWQELLLPSGQRNKASLEQSLKHDPLEEYRQALCLNRDSKEPARFHVPNNTFHAAIAAAALDIPGAAKTKIERLTSVTDLNINLFGVPFLFMAMVRNSDPNRTPDVRTRPIFPEWACTVTVEYSSSALTQRGVVNLIAAAGRICGIGDNRPNKGGSFGRYKLVADNDPVFRRIVKDQGRVPQQAAYNKPAFYDEDTAELMTWFEAEIARREKKLPSQRMVEETHAGNGAPANQ